ncbi:hypothetical protein BU24DRAFT_462633 [Aaosphaeria arxii CBS 175.79]|uniref:Uncharacterized protein n=1 Tax=Aaosphaeria arxii CBS 175.79 TaxID=1450172 RepID=A0A6A5XW70_9PLEO|nr:uncharacterized protein BU24DRAFT_462633 [Aaosphaeria arxii CBS 175.79]KAF2016484.1 hypothetical protein BU24DRAFT_462633 [Aaosphaeria arxii CBS 175.79]
MTSRDLHGTQMDYTTDTDNGAAQQVNQGALNDSLMSGLPGPTLTENRLSFFKYVWSWKHDKQHMQWFRARGVAKGMSDPIINEPYWDHPTIPFPSEYMRPTTSSFISPQMSGANAITTASSESLMAGASTEQRAAEEDDFTNSESGASDDTVPTEIGHISRPHDDEGAGSFTWGRHKPQGGHTPQAEFPTRHMQPSGMQSFYDAQGARQPPPDPKSGGSLDTSNSQPDIITLSDLLRLEQSDTRHDVSASDNDISSTVAFSTASVAQSDTGTFTSPNDSQMFDANDATQLTKDEIADTNPRNRSSAVLKGKKTMDQVAGTKMSHSQKLAAARRAKKGHHCNITPPKLDDEKTSGSASRRKKSAKDRGSTMPNEEVQPTHVTSKVVSDAVEKLLLIVNDQNKDESERLEARCQLQLLLNVALNMVGTQHEREQASEALVRTLALADDLQSDSACVVI